MSQLRIAHVIRTLDPATGGPTVVCLLLAGAQARLGHTVIAIAESASALAEASAEISIKTVGRTTLRDRMGHGAVAKALQSLIPNLDILHLHGVWDTLLQMAAGVAHAAGVPYVMMPHGMIDPWSLAQKAWKKRIALALGTRRILRNATALHLLYREEREYARRLSVLTRGEVIPNGVTLTDIDPIPQSGTIPGLGDHPYVLFLGRLHHKKGLDYLAEAFVLLAGRFPEAHLVVAGADDGAQAAFASQIARLGLTDRVHLVGPIYGARKWAALAGAACFCLLSRQEGFSVAVLEALACRCPVVISDQCHFPEVVTAGAGIVVPLEVNAIADALATVFSDLAKAKSMGIAGRMLIEKQYTWDRVAEQTIRLYRSCIGKNQS